MYQTENPLCRISWQHLRNCRLSRLPSSRKDRAPCPYLRPSAWCPRGMRLWSRSGPKPDRHRLISTPTTNDTRGPAAFGTVELNTQSISSKDQRKSKLLFNLPGFYLQLPVCPFPQSVSGLFSSPWGIYLLNLTSLVLLGYFVNIWLFARVWQFANVWSLFWPQD